MRNAVPHLYAQVLLDVAVRGHHNPAPLAKVDARVLPGTRRCGRRSRSGRRRGLSTSSSFRRHPSPAAPRLPREEARRISAIAFCLSRAMPCRPQRFRLHAAPRASLPCPGVGQNRRQCGRARPPGRSRRRAWKPAARAPSPTPKPRVPSSRKPRRRASPPPQALP